MNDYGRTSILPPDPNLHQSQPRIGTPSELELRALLEQHQGNVAAVGRVLGKARMQIHRWVERYNIVLDDYRVSVTGDVPREPTTRD